MGKLPDDLSGAGLVLNIDHVHGFISRATTVIIVFRALAMLLKTTLGPRRIFGIRFCCGLCLVPGCCPICVPALDRRWQTTARFFSEESGFCGITSAVFFPVCSVRFHNVGCRQTDDGPWTIKPKELPTTFLCGLGNCREVDALSKHTSMMHSSGPAVGKVYSFQMIGLLNP